MAVLSDVYKTRNNREIVLTPYQARVFEATLEKFKKDGVGGDDIFEETYVLQKQIAEYITGNITQEGGSEVVANATQTYNFILGIETAAPVVPEPIIEEEVVNNDPLPISPVTPIKPRPFKPPVKTGPKNIPFRDLRPKGRPFRPRSMAEFLANGGRPVPNPAPVSRQFTRPTVKNPFGLPSFGNFGESPAGSIASALRNRGGLGSRGFMDLFRRR